MVGRVTWAALVCLTAVSCNSIFDSYFPETLEYLDSQVSLSDALGGKSVVSIQLRYLPAAVSQGSDVLAVVAGTSDGGSHVLFYNPSNLAPRRSYSDSDFKAQNSGTVPNLGLIAQDGQGIYTGVLAYNPVTLSFDTTLGTPGSYFSTANYQGSRETWDGASAVVFAPANNLVYYSSGTYLTLATPSNSISGVVLGSGTAVLDAAAVGGTYYVAVSSGSTVLFASGSSPGAVSVVGTKSMGQTSPNGDGAWVTSGAAIVQNRNNNTSTFTAYSWAGDTLGTLHLYTANNQITALAFEPRGGAWYLFDSSTGKLSRNRPWW